MTQWSWPISGSWYPSTGGQQPWVPHAHPLFLVLSLLRLTLGPINFRFFCVKKYSAFAPGTGRLLAHPDAWNPHATLPQGEQ